MFNCPNIFYSVFLRANEDASGKFENTLYIKVDHATVVAKSGAPAKHRPNRFVNSSSTCLLCADCLCYLPLAHVGTGQVMGWGEKAIEVRSVQTGQLDGVFMHKRVQAFTFLCERNEKVI